MFEYYLNTYYNFQRFTKITDQIYLGGNMYDKTFIDNYEITHILNVSDDWSFKPIACNAHYHNIPICEYENRLNIDDLYCAVDYLNKIVKENAIIYVNCVNGVNRSPAIVILYLIHYHNYTLYEAYKQIAQLRYICIMPEIFDVVYQDALSRETNTGKIISPLKICTHKISAIGDDTRLLFVLYDYIHLEKLTT